MFDKRLVLLLIVCVVFMVWLGIEGFIAYIRSPQQMMSLKFGLGKVTGGTEFEVNKTASDFPNEGAFRSASIWQALNMSDKKNIYREFALDKKLDEKDAEAAEEKIRKMIRDPNASRRGPSKWLSFFDATDYSANSPDIVRTSSGSYLQKRTGSRWNETSYIDSLYFEEDSDGGRQLMQCAPDDFACIRLLSYSDPGYQPYQSDGSWMSQFGGGGAAPTDTSATEAAIRAARALAEQRQRAAATAAQGAVAPAGASSNQQAPAPSSTPDTDISKCLIDTAILITNNFPAITDSNQKLSLARAICTGKA